MSRGRDAADTLPPLARVRQRPADLAWPGRLPISCTDGRGVYIRLSLAALCAACCLKGSGMRGAAGFVCFMALCLAVRRTRFS